MFIKLAGDGVGEKCAAAVPFVIGAIIVGSAAEIYEEKQAEEAQEEALEVKRKQAQAKAAQDQIDRDDQMMHVQSAQLAEAAAQGMAPSSGTVGALQLGSYNKFAESSAMGKYNLISQNLAIDKQMSALEDQFWAQAFGTVVKAAGEVAGLSGPTPTTGTSQNTTGVFEASNYQGSSPTPTTELSQNTTGVLAGNNYEGGHDFWADQARQTANPSDDWLNSFMEPDGPFAKKLREGGQ